MEENDYCIDTQDSRLPNIDEFEPNRAVKTKTELKWVTSTFRVLNIDRSRKS